MPLDEGKPAGQTPAAAPAPQQQQAKADVSPLAAVIGIALLGGMLLIGVLIGRGASDDPPAPVVQVGEAPAGDVSSEWPAGTDGFTIQLSTLGKADSNPDSVDQAVQTAVGDGAADAAVLDSDLYASLPPGNYVIYSGVYTDRRSAEVALKGLRTSFPSATVVEVADSSSDSSSALPEGEAIVPGTTTETTPDADK